jgi:hypothetical protein
MKVLLSAGVGALALGLVATSAQAAPPAGNLTGAIERDAGDGGLVQEVRRRYWDYDDDYRYRRYNRYRYYRYDNYDDDYYRRHRYYYQPFYFNYRYYRYRNL